MAIDQRKTVRFISANTRLDTGQTITLYGATNEDILDPNRVQEHDVEDGFQVTQYSRKLPVSGSVDVLLSDHFVPDAIGAPSIKSLSAQHSEIKHLAQFKDTAVVLRYRSQLYDIDRVLIESLSTSRDRITGIVRVTIKWKEVRTATQAAILTFDTFDSATGISLGQTDQYVGNRPPTQTTAPPTAVTTVSPTPPSGIPQIQIPTRASSPNSTASPEEFYRS